jgi:hypothetical protein
MYCAHCGKEVQAGKAHCGNCGAPAPTPSDEQPTHPAAPDSSGAPPFSLDFPEPSRWRLAPIVLIVVIALLLVVVSVVAIFLILKSDENASTMTTVLAATTTLAGTDTTAGAATTVAPDGTIDLVDLSLGASSIEASSILPDQGPTTYVEANLLDNRAGTCWAEDAPGYGVGEHIDFSWATPVTLRQVRIVPGYDKTADGWDRWTSNGRVRTFDLVFSDGTTESFTVTDTRPLQTLTFAAPHNVSSVRFVITGYYEAAPALHKAEDTSVAELHFWGTE